MVWMLWSHEQHRYYKFSLTPFVYLSWSQEMVGTRYRTRPTQQMNTSPLSSSHQTTPQALLQTLQLSTDYLTHAFYVSLHYQFGILLKTLNCHWTHEGYRWIMYIGNFNKKLRLRTTISLSILQEETPFEYAPLWLHCSTHKMCP
jgi:hypothetical protein